jgi:hypothetical protein
VEQVFRGCHASDAVYQVLLTKKREGNHYFGQWKQRFFVLTSATIDYYDNAKKVCLSHLFLL